MNTVTKKIKQMADIKPIVNELVPVTASSVALGTLSANTPSALVHGAVIVASELANVIKSQNLATTIQGRQHVKVEGWTTLGVMLGCVAREIETTEHDGIYVAVVELIRMIDGACINRASAECGSDDEKDKYGKPIWANRPRYARRSMAQTRATGKACRLAFSWIMSLAGYEVTPAEEMPTEDIKAKISASQHKLLEAQIRDYKLDRERVKTWLGKKWGIAHFPDLSPEQFEILLSRLERWAAEEYARSETEAALSPCPF
jgi:hypothetical protein